MATFAVTIEFDVKAGSFAEARTALQAIIDYSKEEDLCDAAHEVDVEHTRGDLEDAGDE